MCDFPQNKYVELARLNGHSEEFIKLTNNYIMNLNNNGYPVIFSLKHFSSIIGISYSELSNMIHRREFYYRRYEISKKSGGKRTIVSPNNRLKEIQIWIYKNILNKNNIHSACKGFRKGISIVDNAKIHINNDWILKLDLEDFFGSITEKKIYYVFKDMGYHSNLSVYLAQLTTVNIYEVDSYSTDFDINNYCEEPVLPQGAPTSPILSNIVAKKLDERLFKLSKRLGANYSRYADDITFSGKLENIPSISVLDKIITECGFKVNYKKIRRVHKKQGQIITGLSVTNGVKVPKKYKKETKKHLYYCKKYGVYEHLKYLKENKNFSKSGFREWLLGRIYFINSVEPEVAKEMLKDFDSINWSI